MPHKVPPYIEGTDWLAWFYSKYDRDELFLDGPHNGNVRREIDVEREDAERERRSSIDWGL